MEVLVVWGGVLPSHWVNLSVEDCRIEGAVYDSEALLDRRQRFRIRYGELSTIAECILLTVDTPNFYLMLMSYFEYIAIPANVVCFFESQSRLKSDKRFIRKWSKDERCRVWAVYLATPLHPGLAIQIPILIVWYVFLIFRFCADVYCLFGWGSLYLIRDRSSSDNVCALGRKKLLNALVVRWNKDQFNFRFKSSMDV